MLRLTVCVSGGGTNLQALLDAIDRGEIADAEVTRVISNNAAAYALERARMRGIEAVCVSPKSFDNREEFNQALLHTVEEGTPDLVVLAGFLVVIPEDMTRKFAGRIINIHPSLIPSFCGTGCYGLRVHEKVIARGVKVTGATVHFVNEGTDTGPIILQQAVEVLDDDTPETLQRRVMEQAEWKLLPEAVRLIAQGRLQWVDGKCRRIRE